METERDMSKMLVEDWPVDSSNLAVWIAILADEARDRALSASLHEDATPRE